MGLTYLTVQFKSHAKARKQIKHRFLVDSGAVYSVIDENFLDKIGVKPHSQRKFILADGQEIEKKIGDVFFEYSNQKGSAPAIFGDKGIFLLGATTLENLGLILNPIDRELRPLPMII